MTDVSAAYTVEQALTNLQQTEDPSARYYAAWWIGRFRVTDPTAIAALVAALQDETDRSPDGGYPLRRNAAKALGKLADPTVVPALIQALDCDDYYVREAAVRALGELQDSQAIPALLNLLAGGVEAAQLVPGKPHLAQPYEAILEALGTLQAKEAVPQLEPFLDHFAPKVQYAAARALYQLTLAPTYAERLIQALQGPDLQLRRSAMMDLGATGYLAGALAIAQTFAENSLKLIALRDLWMAHQQRTPQPDALTPETEEILALMDGLL
ncbi:HEAT repeat domain-containing protein [Synechocystis sp. LKSZ1]|uniref:HEAT repeat domain-containing protein n=1 Tax=Synechocystis sp. LKSZ1 TaxID=3144951 RepID=UPI00336BE0BB